MVEGLAIRSIEDIKDKYMVKIILNREECSMVLGWIGKAQVDAEEYRIPWDEFENRILNKFKKAME